MRAILRWIIIRLVCGRTYSELPGTCSCCPGLWGSGQYRGTGRHRWTARTLWSERRPVRRSVRQRFRPSSVKRKARVEEPQHLTKEGKERATWLPTKLHSKSQYYTGGRRKKDAEKNPFLILNVWTWPQGCFGWAALLPHIKTLWTTI